MVPDFLDVSVRREGKNLRTGVFRKKTHTDRVLSFDSNHPISAKRAVVLSMFDRVETHFAKDDEEGRQQEVRHLFRMLGQNGYSERFVRKTVEYALKMRAQKKPELDQPKATAVIPYVRGLSEQISRELRKIGVRVVSRANPWQWTLCTGIKDTIPDEKKKGVVYQIRCSECPASYIGETARSVKVRVSEHERHTKYGRTEESAVAEHVWDTDHKMEWKKVRILDMERNWQSRRVREALRIEMNNPSLNRDKGLELSPFWMKLLPNK